ncbi:cell division protein ZapC domain-containing protein [Catenovulum maritimum]|uniref:Cell division protein ZapC n=1 Tax=Catenovulum maritimum TaxID=1513271 RepID=A0A0J8GU07_9ALTE|nr:cell division protein ZapC domain-containing protein [Catenovulum maritimum]KMT64799.1 hypothetical protein XM47_12145 [Catenovulum maritimum]
MLQAKADWYWFFDDESQTIRLNTTDFVFVTACCAKHLLPHAESTVAFSVDDNQVYTEFYAYLEDELKLAEALCVQIALNALAHLKFTQFTQPKSWYFAVQNGANEITAQSLVRLQSEFEIGQFLTLESQDDFPVVMLLSKSMKLTESKSLSQFDVIKVMKNRFISLSSNKTQQSFNLFRA